jgi:uncharacterized membrane protein
MDFIMNPWRVHIGKIMPALILMMASALLAACSGQGPETQKGGGGMETVKNADIVVPIESVSEKALFLPAEIDGTKLEVIAVKAPDGTIRLAFNTCQVCYDSGRGYYKQEGRVLACQNCGNRFSMDRVGVESGGCNPVPIFQEYTTADETSITIPLDFLTGAQVIFSNWKNGF